MQKKSAKQHILIGVNKGECVPQFERRFRCEDGSLRRLHEDIRYVCCSITSARDSGLSTLARSASAVTGVDSVAR